MIASFTGKWHNLSNFGEGKVRMGDGINYPRREHAFQAQKTFNMNHRRQIAKISQPAEAKRVGQLVVLRPDWEQAKVTIMHSMLKCAFEQNAFLAELLDATKGHELIEGNYHHDTFWGACICQTHKGRGQNHLGLLLMAIRAGSDPRAQR